MWPWEHLAFGYIVYSILARTRTRWLPSDAAVIALAVATQFPDLVDKPLAWTFGVFQSGIAMGHSLLFVIPVSLLSLYVAARIGKPGVGLGVTTGLLTHIAGDVLYPVLTGDGIAIRYFMWPLYRAPGGESDGFLLAFEDLLLSFVTFLSGPTGMLYLAFEGLLLGVAVGLWIADDFPGTIRLRSALERSLS